MVMLIQVSFRTDDAVNQSAARLAREFGEERTIGDLFLVPRISKEYS